MRIKRTIRVIRFILAAILITILLQGCGTSLPTETPTSSPQDRPSPVPPSVKKRPITKVKISPVQIDPYLTNPGIGWQDGPKPFGTMHFPETVAYSNRREIAWSKLNPKEGVYDWSVLDKQLNGAVHDGKQYSFRVYTYVGEGYAGNVIPAWVLKKGARLLQSGEPDYSNCVYQEAWGDFVSEMVRRYDGNPD